MWSGRTGRVWAGVLAAVVLIGIAVYSLRGPIARAALPAIVGAATGTKVSFGGISLHGGHATLTNVTMSAHGGERLAYVPRVDISYNLHDLLPGSKHRFGLHSIVVYRPQITIVHNPDGSYNLPKMAKGGPSNRTAAPLNATLRVVNGSIAVIDDTRVDPSARRLSITGVNVDAAMHTDSRSTYRASMAYVDGEHSYPIHGAGVIDTPAGFTLHHWTAAHVPLPQLVNYALNNANIRMRAGFLDNLDARYYGSISASAQMRGAEIAMQGVQAPIRNVHGALDVTSAGLTTPRLTATVAGAPVYVTGGIYDLKKPQFRLTVTAHSDVARIKQMAAAAAKLPMRGPVNLAMLVEGPVRTPIAFIALHSPEIDYRNMPLRDPDGTIAFDGKTANVLHFTVRYAGFSLAARGRMALQKEPNAVEAVASVTGPSDEVPYASSLLPPMQLQGMLLATGDSLKQIQTQGVLGSDNGDLASVFRVTANGTGSVNLKYADTLAARIALEHPRDRTAALVQANDFTIRKSHLAALPGLNVKALPPVTGTLNGTVFAATSGKQLGLAGNIDVRDAQYGKIAVADAKARFGGAPGDVRVSSLRARGSFGTLDATGTIAGTNHIALEGRFNGSLAALAQLAGNMPASGSVNAPIALVYDRGRSIAQIRDARFSGAQIRGVPIEGLSATIGTQGKNVRVYAARATLAKNGSAVASGSIGRRDSKLALSVSHVNLTALHGVGVPLQAGYADLAATAAGSLRAPDVQGAMLLDQARYGKYPVTGDAAFAYTSDTLNVHDATIGMGPAIVAVDGSIAGIRMGAPMQPQYDLNAVLRSADAHALVAFAQPKLAKQYIEGSIDANVHVGGAGKTPAVSGNFDVPAGSVHGLAFRDLRGTLGGTPQDFSVSGGHVTVGSTNVAFGASVGGGAMRAGIYAPQADLADFNDYFDTGDTLGGTGRLALSVDTARQSFLTSGSVDLANVRYRRMEIGNAVADWRTVGRTIAMRANVGGPSGRAHISGTASLPASSTIADIATNADTNMTATVRDVDLGTWLPMLGFNAPVTGRIDADATARGRYPDISLTANANVRNGTVGRIRVEQAHVAISAYRGHGEVRQAVVRIPYLTAQGSGTFGFHARDPLQIALHATSPDLGKLMTTVSGKAFDASGTLDTTLHVAGTRADPQLRDDFTLASVRYAKFTVPKLWGTLAGNLHTVKLEHGEVDLQRGRIIASGSAPVHPTRNAPVAFDLNVQNVDFSDFNSAFPEGYHLAGTMGGAMNIRGTLDAPQLNGAIALHNGYFVGPIDQNPIQKINGTLAFAGNTVAIRALRADVGGGTFAMDGTAVVPNFRRPKDATFTARMVANGAQFNSPKYFRGKVDANVLAYRRAGGIPTLTGDVTVPSARIPLTAFWNPHAPKTPPRAPLPLAFDLHATVGNDVRVQSTGVDVGAQGAVAVAGTLAHPTLNGAFTSTGGNIDFIRRFTIQSARVRFNPDNGIMPYVNAVATTQVSNPLTYIALHVSGLAPNNMQIAFDSDPAYSRAQIIGLLSGITNPNGTGGGLGTLSATSELQNLAMGQINTYFTQQLLEPLSASLGNALGLQNLQLTDDFTSGFGLSAAKAFGKHITAVFNQNLGEPQRVSLSIQAHRSNSTAFDLMFYQTKSSQLLGFTPSTNMFGFNDMGNSSALNPMVGNSGFSFMYEHKFQ